MSPVTFHRSQRSPRSHEPKSFPRIAILHNLQDGGAFRTAREWLTYMGGQAFEVRLEGSAALSPEGFSVPSRASVASRDLSGTQRMLRPLAAYGRMPAIVRAWKQAADTALRSGADLLFLQGCRYFETPPAALFSDLPSIYFAAAGPRRRSYDPASADKPTKRFSAHMRPWNLPLEELEHRIDAQAYRSTRLVLAPSSFSARWLHSAYGGEPPRVVKSGVSEHFRYPREPAPLNNGSLLFVGRLEQFKRPDLVIRVGAAVQRPVRLVGAASNLRYRDELARLAASLRVDLTITGALDDSDLINEYRAAHALLHPCPGETLGLVSLEAQACGCPVVVSAHGGVAETVVDGTSGFVASDGIDGWASAVGKLENPDLRAKLAESARRSTVKLTWEASGRQVIDEISGFWEKLREDQGPSGRS